MNPLGLASIFFPIFEKFGLFDIERYNSIFESYFLFFRLDTTKLGIKPEFVEFDFAGSPIIIKIPVIPIEIQLSTNFSISFSFLSLTLKLTVIGISGISLLMISAILIGDTLSCPNTFSVR